MPAAIAAGMMFSLPFLLPFHRLPFPSFESEWLAVVLGLLCVLALLVGMRRDSWTLPKVALAPVSLLAVVALQAIAGVPAYASNALVLGAYLAWAALLAIAGHRLTHALGAARLQRLLAWALLGGGVLSALIGVAQCAGLSSVLILPLSDPGAGVYANLAQQNHFATYVALALASAVYLLRQKCLSLWLGVPAAVLLVAALALSGSRSSVLYIACIAAAWLGCRGKGAARGLLWLFLAGAACVALLAFAARGGVLGPRFARLGSYEGAFGPRFFLWQQAWHIFLQHPLLGAGIDRFAFEMVNQLGDGQRIYGIDQYAHNLGFQLLAVTGVAGFAALFVPLALFVRRLLRDRTSPGDQWLWAVLGILFVHSMLEQPLYYAYFLGIAALVAGSAETRAIAWRPPLFAGVPCLVLALLAMGIAGSDYHTFSSNFYGPDVGDPYDARHQALALELHRDPLLRPITELVSPASFVAADAPVSDRLTLNTRLLGYAPIADVAFRQASLLAEAGRQGDAMRQFDRAARAYPEETAQYALRFEALAAGDPANFGALAAHIRARKR